MVRSVLLRVSCYMYPIVGYIMDPGILLYTVFLAAGFTTFEVLVRYNLIDTYDWGGDD